MLLVGDDVAPRNTKGKEATKTSEIQKYLGGTYACMKRLLIMANKHQMKPTFLIAGPALYKRLMSPWLQELIIAGQ